MSGGWREALSEVLGALAIGGVGLVVVQRLALSAHLSGLAPSSHRLSGAVSTKARRGISILKPLCGIDDGLADNLEMFASLSYAPYELLLGVPSESDPAYSLAQHIAAKHPKTTKVVVQQGAPGLNPKVNQLISLERAARFGIVLISDSNTRPPIGYLDEMSQMFEDPKVGCASNPIPGMGHKTWGARFDNMHMAAVASSYIAGHTLLGRGYVVGKSQALRRDVLKALGGFEAYKDVLAEDYLLGRDVQRAGFKVAYGRLSVFNYSVKKSLPSFAERASRWSTMQATAEGTILPSLGLALLNPIPLAGLSMALAPSWSAAKVLAGVVAAKVACDMTAAAALGVRPLGWKEAVSIPAKDVVAFGAWARGLVNREVNWRGKKLQVGAETRLTDTAATAVLPQTTAASVVAPTPQQVVAEELPAYLSPPSPTSVRGSPPGSILAVDPVATPVAVPTGPYFRSPRRGRQRARLRRSRLG